MLKTITKQQKQKMYRLHYKLRKRNNTVLSRQRTVIKREITVTPIEQKWLTQLIDFGYCDQNPMYKN